MPAKNSLVAGSLVLWKILAVYCMGVLFIARMPWYLLPIGWALVAAAYSGCLVVGMDCSRSCFFESKAANELVGAVVLLPLFRTLESLRRSKKETSAWLSRLWDCLKTSWSEKCYAISATALIAVSLLGSWYSGLGLMYPVKYWLVPFLYMHLTVGSFTTKSTERYSYLALFPDVKKWAEMEKGMLETMQKASEIIPVYNVKAMHDYVEQQFSNGPNSLKLKQPFHFSLPSTLMNRIMLLRGKRDVILAVAALISLLVFKSAGAIALAVVCFGYCVYSFLVEAKKNGWIENLNKSQAVYITGVHVIAIWGCFHLVKAQTYTLLFAVALWQLSGLGITGGAHRLWAHRSYEASFPFRLLMLFLNAMANQGSIYHWARDHRVHHMCSETEADPHNAKRGFFFAHMGWLYLKKDPKVAEAGKKIDMDDLLADPIVRFQKRYDPWFNMFVCFVVPSIIPWVCWGESLLTAYLVAGVLRYVWVLHMTWCVNSFAHLFGDRPYDKESNPAENLLVSIGAVGEGWHNWHHFYPYDYAASELGIAFQWNPTKVVIDIGAWLGLVSNRKRATGVWKRTQDRRIKDHLDASAVPAEEEKQTVLPREATQTEFSEKVEPLPKILSETDLTIRKIRAAIPDHCFKRSSAKSLAHLAYDCFVVVSSAALVVYASHVLGWYWMVLLWPLYWWYQGINATALWVLAHECGHGGFSDSKVLNDAVGYVLHSFLLTPYFSWAITHAKHHRRTNHMTEGETWVPVATSNPDKPKIKFLKTHLGTCLRIAAVWIAGWYMYLFNNTTGAIQNQGQSHFDPDAKALFRPNERSLVLASNAGLVAMLAVLVGTACKSGLLQLIAVYLIPQIICNIYLVSITRMQHTHPDVPHMKDPEWNWLAGALSTVDRSMGSWVDSKLHHISDSHVVHHLFSDMPFYGAKEATPYVAKFLAKYGDNVYKTVPTGYLGFWWDFYWNMKESMMVMRDMGDGLFYFAQ
uniref:Fatty acid desaturase domain-containing protein n=1 Tax=Eutreptiella gymnastica TaxID=73025 RepID=A0A7S4LDM5_9EUGL